MDTLHAWATSVTLSVSMLLSYIARRAPGIVQRQTGGVMVPCDTCHDPIDVTNYFGPWYANCPSNCRSRNLTVADHDSNWPYHVPGLDGCTRASLTALLQSMPARDEVMLFCGHMFHKSCLLEKLEEQSLHFCPYCPVCEAPATKCVEPGCIERRGPVAHNASTKISSNWRGFNYRHQIRDNPNTDVGQQYLRNKINRHLATP